MACRVDEAEVHTPSMGCIDALEIIAVSDFILHGQPVETPYMRTKIWLLVATLASLALASCAPSKPTVTIAPSATPAPTATVDALKTPLPSQGWVAVPALAFAKGIAFSKSDPFTGYACGNVGIDVARTPADVLQLSVTHDGGRTWSAPAATTVPGAGCNFSINPANASDLVMMAWHCYGGCNPGPSPYRSYDGGKTWEALKLDPTQWQSGTTIGWIESNPAWVGNTTYFAMVAGGAHGPIPQPQHAVVSNTTGGLLSAADAGIYDLINDPQVYPGSIWTYGSTLVLSFEGSIGYMLRSTDDGKSWQKFTVSLSLPPTSGVFSADGTDLDVMNGSDIQVSSDGGVTWRHLPTLPAMDATYFPQGLFHLPDGTYLLVGPTHIWQLAPGASAWQDATKIITDQYGTPVHVLAFSTDATGHPVLAWSEGSRNLINGVLQPGVSYHGLA